MVGWAHVPALASPGAETAPLVGRTVKLWEYEQGDAESPLKKRELWLKVTPDRWVQPRHEERHCLINLLTWTSSRAWHQDTPGTLHFRETINSSLNPLWGGTLSLANKKKSWLICKCFQRENEIGLRKVYNLIWMFNQHESSLMNP